MNTYEVVLSLGASACMTVEAESPEEARDIAEDEFWKDEVGNADVWSVDEAISIEEV